MTTCLFVWFVAVVQSRIQIDCVFNRNERKKKFHMKVICKVCQIQIYTHCLDFPFCLLLFFSVFLFIFFVIVYYSAIHLNLNLNLNRKWIKFLMRLFTVFFCLFLRCFHLVSLLHFFFFILLNSLRIAGLSHLFLFIFLHFLFFFGCISESESESKNEALGLRSFEQRNKENKILLVKNKKKIRKKTLFHADLDFMNFFLPSFSFVEPCRLTDWLRKINLFF